MITKIGRQTKILIIIVLLVVLIKATYAHGLTSIKNTQKYTHDNNTGGGVFGIR